MTTTTEEFAAWIATLPKGQVEIAATHPGGMNATAKRVVCYRDRKTGNLYITTNSMGTHLTNEFYEDNEIIGRFQP